MEKAAIVNVPFEDLPDVDHLIENFGLEPGIQERLYGAVKNGNVAGLLDGIEEVRTSVKQAIGYGSSSDRAVTASEIITRGITSALRYKYATPLHLAVKRGHKKIVSLLIKNGADVDAVDRDGNTPLHWAVKYRQLGVAKLLIDNEADPSLKNKSGQTTLDTAAVATIEKGCDVLYKPLLREKYAMVELLLTNGVSPNLKNQSSTGNGPKMIDMTRVLAFLNSYDKQRRSHQSMPSGSQAEVANTPHSHLSDASATSISNTKIRKDY